MRLLQPPQVLSKGAHTFQLSCLPGWLEGSSVSSPGGSLAGTCGLSQGLVPASEQVELVRASCPGMMHTCQILSGRMGRPCEAH